MLQRHHFKNELIYLRKTQYYVMKTFLIRQKQPIIHDYLLPQSASMTSASNSEQYPRHISISEETQNGQILCSMIWLLYSTYVQLISDISNTTSSIKSFVCLLFEGRQTRGFLYRPLIHHSTLCNCFVFCYKQTPKQLNVSAS